MIPFFRSRYRQAVSPGFPTPVLPTNALPQGIATPVKARNPDSLAAPEAPQHEAQVEETQGEEATNRTPTNRIPRSRDPERGDVLWRTAWVDPALPPYDVPAEATELHELLTTLRQEGRGPTASWLAWLYNRQVLESVHAARQRTQEAYRRVRRANESAALHNLEIDAAQQQLAQEKDAALVRPLDYAQSRRLRAERAHQVAARRAANAAVEYDPASPSAAIRQYERRALREAGAIEELADAVGDEQDAVHQLEQLPDPPLPGLAAPTRPGKAPSDAILNAITVTFGIAAFVSLMTAAGALDPDKVYSGAAFSESAFAFLVWIPACVGAAKALSLPLGWFGEIAATLWLRDKSDSGARYMFGAGATLGAVSIVVDAAIHRSGFLGSAMLAAENEHQSVGAGEQAVYWLMAAFLITGYVVCSFAAGLMKAWRHARFEADCRQHAAYLQQERRREFHGVVGKARQRQEVARARRDTAPLHRELAQDPVLHRLAAACNRALTLEHIAGQADADVQSVRRYYDSRIGSLEARHLEMRDTPFPDDRLLIEEAVYTAHVEIASFRAQFHRAVRETELPELIRRLRMPLWVGEPRRFSSRLSAGRR